MASQGPREAAVRPRDEEETCPLRLRPGKAPTPERPGGPSLSPRFRFRASTRFQVVWPGGAARGRWLHLEALCLVTQSCPTLRPHGLEPARLLCPWDSLGNNTGVGCHALLQGIFPNPGVEPRSLHCRRILTLRATREACTTKTRISERILQSVFKMQMPIRVILKFFENHKMLRYCFLSPEVRVCFY